MNLFQVATKTALFLQSIEVLDIAILDSVTSLVAGESFFNLSEDEQTTVTQIISNGNTNNYIRRYTTAQLGCNLGGLSKKQVESLMVAANLITLTNGKVQLTELGREHAIVLDDKPMWYQSVCKVLRKLK